MSSMIRFTAHESAPSAEQAYAGELVPRDLGTHALHFYTKAAAVDTSTNPPALRLEETPVNLIEGSLYGKDGKFEPYPGKDSVYLYVATGVYQGPGSELVLKQQTARR